MASSRLELGAPGIYRVSPATAARLAGEPLDACGFVGVAPRGPAWVPIVDEAWREDQPTIGPGHRRRRSVAIPVASWAEYRERFGGLAWPGRLPWAVRAFFEQGGRLAWIVRIVAELELDPGGDPLGLARVVIPGIGWEGGKPVRLFARDEGSWANTLRVAIGFARTPLVPSSWTDTSMSFGFGEAPPLGSLIRASYPNDPGKHAPELRFITGLVVSGEPDRAQRRVDASLSADWSLTPERLELVVAELWLDDGEGRRELHAGLGLSPAHPRWIATVLCHESALAWPDEAWIAAPLEVPDTLDKLDRDAATLFAEGSDRYASIVTDNFFDPTWDPRSGQPGSGLTALADAGQVASVVVPDLYHPQALIVDQSVVDVDEDLGSADWQTCLELEPLPPEPQEPVFDELVNLIVDVGSQLDVIADLQRDVVALAEQLRIVALLDVPPGLDQRGILRWRQRFDSSWAAAYMPWLRLASTSEEPDRETPMRLGPAAIAAGIIARRELAFGVPHGPANELAAGVVDVEDRVSPSRHDQLHPRGLNVFVAERDGVRLSAARTLSSDASVRQLSVRRLMQLLTRTLERQLQWAVFEPNDGRLRQRLRDALRSFLRGLYRQGAFRGANESEAFFVRCDVDNNPRELGDRGELLVEIGVAPAEPLEFIVLIVTRDGDGQLEVVPR
ncbi:phage tail sheath C-terminal domain-containing protein [Nannocystaceae bacterium ST9]